MAHRHGIVFGPRSQEQSAFLRALLADTISTRLQRPVVDRTGLTGFFDVEIRFRPPNSATATDTNEPDLVTALGEQLGLRLESTRGPVQVTVFDRIERPTPN